MICILSVLKYWFFSVLCWGIQAKWESWVTVLLGEPWVRSSLTRGTSELLELNRASPQGRGKTREETWTSLWKHAPFRASCSSWYENRNLDFVPPPLQHQVHLRKGRKRGRSMWVQEGAIVGNKEKRNFLQRNKNLRKWIKRFRKKWTVLPGGQLLCCMTHCPTTTSRTRMEQRFVLIFTPGWGKIPAGSKTVVIRWERLFGMQWAQEDLESGQPVLPQWKICRRKAICTLFIFTRFSFIIKF